MSDQNELDDLLKPLLNVQPNSLQMQSWKNAVQSELRKTQTRPSKYRLPLQLAAAMLVGFVLGGVLFHSSSSGSANQEWMQNVGSNATFERVHTNLD